MSKEIGIQPLGERIVIKPDEPEGKTPSGLYLPENAKEKQQIGHVVAIGDLKDIFVSVGDKVLFSKYSGTEIKIDNDEYILIEIKNVLARFPEVKDGS